MTPVVTVFTLPLQGHVGAVLPVVQELVDGGARVEVHASEAFRDAAAATGADVLIYPARQFSALESPSANFVTVAALLARLTEQSLLAYADRALRLGRPSVVVVDSMAPWGLLAARRLGIPVVTSTSSFFVHGGLGASPRAALDIVRRLPEGLLGLASIARTRRRLVATEGVDCGGPIRLLSNRGDATVVYTARSLQPGAGHLGDDVRFVGAPLPEVDADDAPLTGELAGVGDGPLAYVSLGTLYNDRPEFYRACADALAATGRQVVMAVGHRVDVRAIGPLPAGVTLVAHAPQRAVLARAEVFITHGGLNSVHEALWQGVPMVVFPQAADQPVVAARMASLGAARVLWSKAPTSSQISRAVSGVLDGGHAAARAAELGRTLRDGGGAAAAADVVLSAATRVATPA